MKFVHYSKDFELPIFESEYKLIADRHVYAYYYLVENEYHYAIQVDTTKLYAIYAVFVCGTEMIDDNMLLEKAHEVKMFFRETIGLQSSHISSSTIREIEALCKFNEAPIENLENSITINQISLEIKQQKNRNNEWWGIVCNNRLLLSLTSESAINRIISVIEHDVVSYIRKRWGRLKK